MDTGFDTGNTEVLPEDTGIVIYSAAEMAGEEGGFSCASVGVSSTSLLTCIFICFCLRRRS